MDFKNYFELIKPNLFNRYKYFVYVDALGYSADKIFFKNGMSRIKFLKEYYQLSMPYVIVTCRIKTKELEMFEESMEELKRNMLIMGYRDYEEYCNDFNKKVMSKVKEK